MSSLKLRLTPAADDDLTKIEKYISEELSNPESAKKVVRDIVEEYEKLVEFPAMGSDISPVLGIVTGFKRLVCGHYNIFYKVDSEHISIYRILYYRREYISVLFNQE